MSRNVFREIEKNIMDGQMDEKLKQKLLQNLLKMREQKINLMITGATGCGKSSTINALFNMEVAKVGVGVDPETMGIEKYELDNLVIWDTPGLGDGKEADNRHSKNIIDKLYEKDSNGNLLIDLVLVILDGSTRDLGTSYELINSVIIPNLGENRENRILVAINQADVAMKGKYWNYEENKPKEKLKVFLDEKVESVRRRIKEGTGVSIEPIYYSAGYKEEGQQQEKPYNLSKLLYYILEHTPKEKRIIYAQNMNQSQEMWKDNDDLKDYRKSILENFVGSVIGEVSNGINTGLEIGSDIGGAIGGIFGNTGESIGAVIGGAIGGAVGAVGGFVGGVCEAVGSFFGGWF